MLCGRYVTASRNTFYNGTSMAPIQLFSDSREAVLFGFVLPGCVAVSFNKKTNMAHFHKEIRDFQTHNANASAPWPKSKKHEWHDLYLLSPPPPTTAENKKTNNLTLIETTMENAITQLIKFDSLANPNIIILF